MTAESDMMRAALERPFDDSPRLILADYVEANPENDSDRARAEFIRLQIAFAANREADVSRRLSTLIDVEQAPAKMLGAGPDWWWSGDCESTIITPRSKPSYTFRRGMVDEVRLTMTEFMGGECGRCRRGTRTGENDPRQFGLYRPGQCPTCKGTRRIPGLAKEIFSKWPATRVVLTCRKPQMYGNYFGWIDVRTRAETTFHIPTKIYEHLCGYEEFGHWRDYRSLESANTALSQAAVNYGRHLAGLPPIQWAYQTKTAPVAQGR